MYKNKEYIIITKFTMKLVVNRDFDCTQMIQTQLLSNEKKGKNIETKNCKCEIQSKREKDNMKK